MRGGGRVTDMWLQLGILQLKPNYLENNYKKNIALQAKINILAHKMFNEKCLF